MVELVLFNVILNQVILRKKVAKDEANEERKRIRKSLGERLYYQILVRHL